MTNTPDIELKNIDPEDISDVLIKIEKSFGFSFGNTELKDVTTFGELCDIITNKVQGDDSNDCTTQQAFYKLRNTISSTQHLDKTIIIPETELQSIFSKQNRRKKIAAIESDLGFKLNILRPKYSVSCLIIIVLLVSIIGLFFYWQVGLAGLFVSITGFLLADKFANELDLKTVGQLSDKISRENYLQARRNPSTINRNEIAKKVKALFSIELDLEEVVLTRQATF